MAKTLEELTAEVKQLQERVDYLEQQMRFSAPVTPRNIISVAAQDHVEPPGNRQTAADNIRERIASAPERAKFALMDFSEEKVAGTWFNRLGILAIMFASVFFLKWSIDNDLIGELGRVVIGATVGLGFLGGGEYFQKRKLKYQHFAEILIYLKNLKI